MSGTKNDFAIVSPQNQVRELLEQIRSRIDAIPALKAREEINAATDSIEVLTGVVFGPVAEQDRWPGVKLTQSEARILGALRSHMGQTVSKEALMDALYFDAHAADDEADIKIVDIFICKMRKRITPERTGYKIQTVWGAGFRLVKVSEPSAALQALKAA